jgi:hypothetical protein
METTTLAGQRRRGPLILITVALCCLPHFLNASAARAAETPLSVRIVPERVTLHGARAGQRFIVLGAFADGLERDVTGQSHFSISDPQIAALDQAGRVVAQADGEFDLKAEVGKQTARARVRIEGSKEVPPFRFARDIGRILTQRGCNATNCHGSVKGKKGFKLSINALYPREDYTWIVEGGIYQVLTTEQPQPRKPRIDRQKPEESLLLRKATAAVSHGGGERLAEGSADYQEILDWIKQGAPYGEDRPGKAARVTRLEIEPRYVVLEAKGKRQLLVTALLSDGRREDLTDKVLYVSNNKEVATVSPDGRVEAVRTGETAILVRAAGQFATVGVGIIGQATADYPEVKGRNFIDDHVFAKLRQLRIVPAPLSRDDEFLRRVCLDLTGTLPPPERVREFVADRDPDKRDKLIETLLDSPQFVDFWTYRFADLFRVNHTSLQKLKRTHLHLDWVRLSIAANKPYDQIAQERIAAQGYGGPTSHAYRIGDLIAPQEIMAEELRVFGGVRLECAQCHNHPFEAWSQDQFWGLAAFFGQLTVAGGEDNALLIDFPAGEAGRKSPRSLTHPRTKQPVKPAFLDGRTPSCDPADLRMALARWMTGPDNPYFARAAVNRVWGYFFGRGIVDPVDDFRSTNPPTHPELLEELALYFKWQKYDLKALMRTIVRSRAYQLSGQTNPTNRADEVNYARSRPRALDAVVLLDAISRVTGVEEQFVWHAFVGGGSTAPGTRAVDLVPEIAPCRFLDAYGRPNRQALPPEKSNQPNLAQALHMLAGTTYTEKIGQKGGRVDRLVVAGVSNRQAVEELYLAALGRLPSEREQTELDALIRRQPTRREALEALAWALLSSREFAYNH